MDDQKQAISFLSDPQSFGATGAVECLETHGACVFLAGDFAYKLKRAVRFPYMDYSTPEARKAMCERELAVNARTAPELYLCVRPIVHKDGKISFGDARDKEILDWVVVMRRFRQDALLERMRAGGRLTAALMRTLAEAVASFHESAEIRRAFGGAAKLSATIDENTRMLGSFAEAPFAPKTIEAYSRGSKAMLERLSRLLDRRRDIGMVRHCHGDLHLNNICLIGGRPILFDAIEFNDDFANIDTFYDLSFLLMDLDRHGKRDFANIVLNRYLELTADYEGVAALPLFLSARAAIRAHVSASAAPHAKVPDEKLSEAVGLLDHATGYLSPAPARLIAIGGVSGTGKSTVSRAIAPVFGAAPGAVVLRTDIIRKRMLGVAETEKLPDSAYEPQVHTRVYDDMMSCAKQVLASGHAVIADAVFGSEEERAAVARAAREHGVRFDGIWLTADPSVLEARIASRRGDASDATAEVLRRQLADITPPADWAAVDAAGAPDEVAEKARRAVSAITEPKTIS
jgi:aminoglycoside phosphotransferase family enzyme/predicted kinase